METEKKQNKSDNMKEYLRLWREKNPDKNKVYMKQYVKRSKTQLCECGGKFKIFAREAHNRTNLHTRFIEYKKNLEVLNNKIEKKDKNKDKNKIIVSMDTIKEKMTDIDIEDVGRHFSERYAKRKMTSGNVTKQTDKNSSLWRRLSTYLKEDKERQTWGWVHTNLETIVKECYNTASSQQSALSVLRLALKECANYAEEEVAVTRTINASLMKEHIGNTMGKSALPINQMSFKEASIESRRQLRLGDNELALYFKVNSGIMPVLRFGDWLNASMEDDGTNNFITITDGLNDSKQGYFTRRISKTMKNKDLVFKLPSELTKYLVENDIKGQLFKSSSNTIFKKLQRLYPDATCNSRSFRTLYCSTKIADIKSASKLTESLEILDHNVKTFLNFYYKGDNALLNCLKDCPTDKDIPTKLIRGFMETGAKEKEDLINSFNLESDNEE